MKWMAGRLRSWISRLTIPIRAPVEGDEIREEIEGIRFARWHKLGPCHGRKCFDAGGKAEKERGARFRLNTIGTKKLREHSALNAS